MNLNYRDARATFRILAPSRCNSLLRNSLLRALRGGGALGNLAFHAATTNSEREELAELGLDEWPECECMGCNCTEPAICTDDGGNACCGECKEYTCDDDGNVLCAKCEGVETVVESCGAGNQTRSYLRLSPPEAPDEDEDGKYALYWFTVGDDAHVVSRHTTYEAAEQAVAAKDWPRPGDNTHYLCGYTVRKLDDGKWVDVDENGEVLIGY